jgi:hypothetical protein
VGAENNQFKELTIDTQGYLQTSTTLFFAVVRRRRIDVLILVEVSVTTAGVHGLTPPPPVI